MIPVIAARELRGFYATPVAWVLLAGAQLLLAWLLFSQLEVYVDIQPGLTAKGSSLGITDLVIGPLLSATALLLLLIIPILGGPAFSAELRSGRIALLLSAPVTAKQIVLGKWLGLVLAVTPVLVLSALMYLTIGLGSALDWGRFLSSFLGLLLLTAVVAAITLWLSSLTSQPLIATALAYGLLFLLWILDSGNSKGLFQLVALAPHMTSFFKGIVNSTDLVYHVALSLFSLTLTTHRIWSLGGGR